jgi:hypothetical protein
VLQLATGLALLRPYYTAENREMFRVLLNATSAAEAALALHVLDSDVPEKPLVTACNLREVLRSMPVSPFAMHVDEETLLRSASLEKQTATLGRTLPDGLELVVTTAGNLVLDVLVKDGPAKYFWTPIPVVEDFVNPDVVDLLVESDHLLDGAIGLVKYAFDALAGLADIF